MNCLVIIRCPFTPGWMLLPNMPDVVSIMLGTNDAANNADASTYKEKLQTIINKVKELNPHAVIILRSPTPVWNAGVRETNIAVWIS